MDSSTSAAEKSRPLGRSVRTLATAAAVVLFVTLAVLQYTQVRTERLLNNRIEQSFETETQLYQLLSLQQDIETSQRGYLLTGQAEFLEPFVDATARAQDTLAELARLLSGSEARLAKFEQLSELLRQKIEFSSRLIEIRRRGDEEEAGRLVAEGQGKAIMDRSRQIVAQLVQDEQREMTRLQHESTQTRARLLNLSIVIEVALVMLLVWSFAAYFANMRRIARLSDEARRQSALEATIFEAATDAMVLLDGERCVKRLNRSAASLFQISEREVVGQAVDGLFAGKDGGRNVRDTLESMLASESAHSEILQVKGIRSDGTNFDAEVAISAVMAGTGSYHLLAIRDATERRRVARMKDEFISTVSHELRTPLTSITASLGLLAGGAGKLDEQGSKLVGIALSNSQRLVRLINDILDVEKIESGKMQFDDQLLELRSVVEEAISTIAGLASELGVTIEMRPGGEGACVTADRDRIVQVLTNLLSNAVKFSPTDSPVEVSIESGEERHRVTVSDRGPGIPTEFKQHIFTRFAQAGGVGSRRKGGTGLGLAIAKEIIVGSGGTIGYDTSRDGTEFFITFPASGPFEGRPSVLLVQVQGAVGKAIHQLLENRQVDVTVVKDLAELAIADERGTYGAVLVDLRVQNTDAAEVIRTIRENPALATTPILATVSDGSVARISRAVSLVDWLDRCPLPAELKRGAEVVRDADSLVDPIAVLHVEDDEDVLQVVGAAFEGIACVEAARSAAEARAILARERPDLVILDIGLPDGNGIELLPLLSDPERGPIPVVVYTASDQDPAIVKRVTAMLTKSKVEIADLVDTLLKTMTENGSDGASHPVR